MLNSALKISYWWISSETDIFPTEESRALFSDRPMQKALIIYCGAFTLRRNC
jgi:hypothetical protein